MSASKTKVKITGEDKTAGAFNSIKNRAATTAGQIRTMVGGALAAMGTYMGLRSIKQSFDDLSHLSDTAQKAGLSVEELTKATNAFKMMGIQNMDVDQFARALMIMEKNTGLQGVEGFEKVVGELSKIPDAAERSKTAMAVFGRSYQEFMPLINAGQEGVEAFNKVRAAVHGVSDAAAETGDTVSDIMGEAANWVKDIWYEGLRMVCGWFGEDFTKSGREAAANVFAGFTYYLQRAMIAITKWFKKCYAYFEAVGSFWGTLIGAKMGGESWSKAFDMATKSYSEGLKEQDEINAEAEARVKRAENKLAAARMKNKDLDKYANALGKGRRGLADDGEGVSSGGSGKAVSRIVNDLVMAGSNAALKMQILGPTLQSESKKQTAFLEKIAKNTEKTAENTEESATADDVGVID